MSDMMTQRDLARRLEQTQVTERPGGITGFDTFYDSNTYTPTYLGLTTAGATTYTRQQGTYIRIGRTCIASGRVTWTAATGTGVAIISIPLTAIFTRVSRFPVTLWPDSITFANGSVTGTIDSGAGALVFVLGSPATNAATPTINVEAAGDLAFTAIYDVA